MNDITFGIQLMLFVHMTKQLKEHVPLSNLCINSNILQVPEVNLQSVLRKKVFADVYVLPCQ